MRKGCSLLFIQIQLTVSGFKCFGFWGFIQMYPSCRANPSRGSGGAQITYKKSYQHYYLFSEGRQVEFGSSKADYAANRNSCTSIPLR